MQMGYTTQEPEEGWIEEAPLVLPERVPVEPVPEPVPSLPVPEKERELVPV